MAVASRGTKEPRLDDPGYWKGRAEEARGMAAQMENPDSKRIMLGIADGYEQMARSAALIRMSRETLLVTKLRDRWR
jgi:hypothetical protein